MKGEAARVWRYCVLARALNSQTNRCPPHCPGPPSHAPITPTTPMRSPLPSPHAADATIYQGQRLIKKKLELGKLS